MDIGLKYGYVIKPLVQEMQAKIREEVEHLTALNIKSLSITVKSIVMEPKKGERPQ